MNKGRGRARIVRRMQWLADMVEPEPKRELVRSAFWLWTMVAAGGAVLVLTTWAVVATRRARRHTGVRKPRRGKRIPDAWVEAGRRIEPIRMDEPPPEVLPEDRP